MGWTFVVHFNMDYTLCNILTFALKTKWPHNIFIIVGVFISNLWSHFVRVFFHNKYNNIHWNYHKKICIFCHLILPWLPSIVLVYAKSKMFKTYEPRLVIKKTTKKWIYNLLLIFIIQTIHKGKIIEHVIQSTLLNVGLQIGVVFVVCCPWDVASSHPLE
jgi:hypothetical protein